MKKLLLFILIAIVSTTVTSAQKKDSNALLSSREPVENITQGMKYKQIKNLYNPKQYTETISDRYSPAWSGVASFIIPGLGQMISREVGRGFAWLGGTVGASIVTGVGSGLSSVGYTEENQAMFIAGSVVTLVGALSIVAIDICAIVDAVRVAKVKNMYEQDLKKLYSLDVELLPSVDYIKTANGTQPTAGFTLAMKF